jgi:hypothetical protein
MVLEAKPRPCLLNGCLEPLSGHCAVKWPSNKINIDFYCLINVYILKKKFIFTQIAIFVKFLGVQPRPQTPTHPELEPFL